MKLDSNQPSNLNPAPDELEDLFALSRKEDVAPPSLLPSTLTALRRAETGPQPAARRKVFFRRGLALAGLSAAAVLALAVIVFSTLVLPAKNPASPPQTALAVQPTFPLIPIPTATTNAVVNNPKESASPMTTQNNSAPTPPSSDGQATTALPGTVGSALSASPAVPTAAANLPSTAAVNPSLAIETPITVTRGVQPGPGNAPVTLYGNLISYDEANGLLLVVGTESSFKVKLDPATKITRRGNSSDRADLKTDEMLAVTGTFNAAGQLEATALDLNPLNVPRPIGPPGHPGETPGAK